MKENSANYILKEIRNLSVIYYNEAGYIEAWELEVSSDGRWTAFTLHKGEYSLYLADGIKKTKKRIMEGLCYNLTWMPEINH